MLLPGKGTPLDGILRYVVKLHSLFQCRAQNAADQPHSSRGTVYAVDEILNRVGVYALEPNSAQSGLDVQPDQVPIVADCGWLDRAQVVRRPHV